eukprot:scaffold92055_cov33-Tisochrysis_lutea.AAC.3
MARVSARANELLRIFHAPLAQERRHPLLKTRIVRPPLLGWRRSWRARRLRSAFGLARTAAAPVAAPVRRVVRSGARCDHSTAHSGAAERTSGKPRRTPSPPRETEREEGEGVGWTR